jgi:hypothetical protein
MSVAPQPKDRTLLLSVSAANVKGQRQLQLQTWEMGDGLDGDQELEQFLLEIPVQIRCA